MKNLLYSSNTSLEFSCRFKALKMIVKLNRKLSDETLTESKKELIASMIDRRVDDYIKGKIY